MIRNRHRRGKYLLRDDESDFVYYSDQVTTNPDGLVIHKSQYDEGQSAHPQNFVRSKNDPRALSLVRPDIPVVVTSLSILVDIGNQARTFGAATHLFHNVRSNTLPIGIGEMVIESLTLPFEVD